jgi:hypothetical protein
MRSSAAAATICLSAVSGTRINVTDQSPNASERAWRRGKIARKVVGQYWLVP